MIAARLSGPREERVGDNACQRLCLLADAVAWADAAVTALNRYVVAQSVTDGFRASSLTMAKRAIAAGRAMSARNKSALDLATKSEVSELCDIGSFILSAGPDLLGVLFDLTYDPRELLAARAEFLRFVSPIATSTPLCASPLATPLPRTPTPGSGLPPPASRATTDTFSLLAGIALGVAVVTGGAFVLLRRKRK